MSAIHRRLVFEFDVADPDEWTLADREAALADLESANYLDYAERQLMARMDGAAEAFMALHPTMFCGGRELLP